MAKIYNDLNIPNLNPGPTTGGDHGGTAVLGRELQGAPRNMLHKIKCKHK